MRTLTFLVLAVLSTLTFFGACSSDDRAAPTVEDGWGAPPVPACDVDDAEIERLVGLMSLRQKIAQMYMVGVISLPGLDVEETRALVEDVGVGGVFAQPLRFIGFSPTWTAENANRLQGMAMGAELPIPLLIACDQEGGIPQAVNAMTGGTDGASLALA